MPPTPKFDEIDWATDAAYRSWRAKVETTGGDGDEQLEQRLRARWYRRTHDPDFVGAEGLRKRAQASSGASAPPPPAASRPAPARTAASASTQITARGAARFAVLALLPFALLLTPWTARAVAAVASSFSPQAAAADLGLALAALGARAYAACLLAALAACLLAVRDKHGLPPLRGVRTPGGLAALRDWAARAASRGVAGDATLAGWALLFLVHRSGARCSLALAPLAVAAAVQEDDGAGGAKGGARLGRFASLPPERLVRGVRSALVRVGAPMPATAIDALAWGLVATALYVTAVRFPLALFAGPPGSARAAGLLAYYLWSLMRARKRAGVAGDDAAWRAVGTWLRPRMAARPALAPVGRVLEVFRVKWWDAVAVGRGA